MLKIKVNDNEVEVEEGLTVLQACEQAGVEIPRFCYHEKLSIAGNCRMCLVEIEKSPKPVASCAMPVADGMIIKTNTEKVESSRKGVMEFLLANHPLDCPVCDQGGECDLQDQSMFYGIDKSRFKENKRFVPEKYMGPLIKTQMTRCIHCTRCVRFATEIAGVPELGAIGRGEDMQITTYLEKAMESEMSANVIDLCPVGALTSKPYVFEARPWELKKTETIDVMDAVGSNIRVDTYGWEVKRVLPKINEDINEEWISDKTRYACDGLKNQRLDTAYIKVNGNFKKVKMNEAYNLILDKIKSTTPDRIAGFIGDLTNMETMFAAKEFFNKILKSNLLDFRSSQLHFDITNRENYIFNSHINGIEESDFILLIGTNPRVEATILNTRIRKSFLKNNTNIQSFSNLGDLTYPYEINENSTLIFNKFLDEGNELYNKFKKSKKPIFVFGESFFKLNSSKYLYLKTKDFLNKHSKQFSEKWKPLNVLHRNASSVGALDLNILSSESGNNTALEKLLKNKLDLIFLFGQDNLNLTKKDEFIIYIGSHGDNGASMADVILPSAAFTEQDGYFTNLEGKLQKAYKATYPPGDAKEEWNIINDLSNLIASKEMFKNRSTLLDTMLNYLNLNQKKRISIVNDFKIEEEKIFVEDLDYYYSNVIARASKTMLDCKNAKLKLMKTGTEG